MSAQDEVSVLQNEKVSDKALLYWVGGVGFTLVIAIIGFFAAKLPFLDHIGPLACSILIAFLYRQFLGYPVLIKSGIQFSSAKLLRLAIILFGLQLNIDIILHQGLVLLVRDVGTIIFAIAVTLIIAKLIKADLPLSLLVGIGTGVCGAAAIAAVSPILKSKEEDTAISVGMVALMGTVFSVAYTIIRPFLPLSNVNYGIWSGISLHEIAHVALAAAPAGQDALAMALLAKLGRVFLLVPLSLILIYWMRGKKTETKAKIAFPWFLLGFIVMSLLGSYVFGKSIPVSQGVLNDVSNSTKILLTMAMVGLGLNISVKDLRSKALKPLIAMFITSILLSIVTYLTVL